VTITLQSQTLRAVQIDGQAVCNLSMSYAATCEIVSATTVQGSYGVILAGTNNTLLVLDESIGGGTVSLGGTFTTIAIHGGQVTDAGTTFTNYTQDGGTVNWVSGGTLTINGGTTYARSLTSATVTKGATLSADGDATAKTWTNLTLGAGATVYNQNRTATLSNPIQLLDGVGYNDVKLYLGQKIKVAVTY
jgi:hypothetical protein